METYILSNDLVQVTTRTLGAEVISFKTKKDQCEYIWQGNPEYWHGQAPIMFPICGRLFEGKYTYNGQTYSMNLHGFFRKKESKMIYQDVTTITYRLIDTNETYEKYPFHFQLDITYKLQDTTLSVTYQILNLDSQMIPFTWGAHPGFNVPLDKGTSFEDYQLVFSKPHTPSRFLFSDTCFCTGKTAPFELQNGTTLPLEHQLFDQDAIFLKDTTRTVTLCSSKTTKSVQLSFDDFSYVGVWHAPKTDAPYVCIEPWLGLPSDQDVVDDFATKHDMIHLAPGATHSSSYSIKITE